MSKPPRASIAAWYAPETPDDQRYTAAWDALYALRSLQSARISAGLLYEALYEQRNAFESTSSALRMNTAGSGAGFDDEVSFITYNAMQVGFDTLVSKLMQADPQVKCLTDNANFETRQKAEITERVLRAAFNETEYYETKEETDLDMLLHGFGVKEHFLDPHTNRPKIERRHPLDCWMDELEARNHPARTFYHTDLVSKAGLKAEYPEFAEQIDAALLPDLPELYAQRGVDPNSMCELVRAWRLPSAPGAGDGMFIRFVSSAQLGKVLPWTRDHFPFVFNNWTKRRRGPYPIPAAEQIAFIQRNLNRLIERKHEAIYTLAVPRLVIDEASGVPSSAFQTSGTSDIIMGRFDGGSKMPTVMNFNVVPQDITQAIMEAKQDIAQILGITAIESVGDKPAGLNSQPAMSEYVNQSGVRHYKTLKENERVTVRDAYMLLETLREARDHGSVTYLTEAMGEYETVDFDDADLPPSALKIELAPANMLPLLPSGRLDRIMQLAQTGVFNPKQMARLFQSPDIMAALSDVTAGEKEVEWTIYEMTKPNGRYLAPTEHTDLTLGLEKVNAAWERCRRTGVPDAVLSRLDQWLAEALLLQNKQQAAAAQAQAQAMLAAQQQQTQMGNAQLNAGAQPGGQGPQQGPQSK